MNIIHILNIVFLALIFVIVDGRRSRGSRGGKRNRENDNFIKGAAANLRSADKRSGGELLSKRERNAVNTILHYHDSHDGDSRLPKWAVDKFRNAQERNEGMY